MKSSKLTPACNFSSSIYIKLEPNKVGLFRFLLEGYDNLALFTALDKTTGLIKVIFAEESRTEVKAMLEDVNELVPLQIVFSPA